ARAATVIRSYRRASRRSRVVISWGVLPTGWTASAAGRPCSSRPKRGCPRSRSGRPLVRPPHSLGYDEGEQGAGGGRWRHDQARTAPCACCPQRIFRCREVMRGDDEAGAAALRQSTERNAGIAAGELALCQEHKIGAVAAGGHRDCAVGLAPSLAVDQAREVRGVLV